MISCIRTWMFNKSLKQHSNFKSRKDFSGVNHCKTHCIIASAETSSMNACEKYKKKLERMNKSVDILYFENNKTEAKVGYSRHDVKCNGVPQNEIIDSILSKEYDLLIFLHNKMENHLRYLAILCNAKLKVGPGFIDSTHIFDLMIESEDYTDTEKLIHHIDQQLKFISN